MLVELNSNLVGGLTNTYFTYIEVRGEPIMLLEKVEL